MTRFHSILLLALVLTGCAHQQPLGLIDDHNLEVPSQQALSRLLGTWQGLLGETGLHVFFRFDQPSRGLTTGLINSPDEGLGTIPITALRIDGDSLHIEFATIKAVFEGRFLSEESAIEGLFTSQSGKIFSLPLERVDPATLAFLVPRFKENGERAFRYTYRPPRNSMTVGPSATSTACPSRHSPK